MREFHRAPYSHEVTRRDFRITIRPFDRNLYGKKTDGVFGIKEVRESRAVGAYGCVSAAARLRARLSLGSSPRRAVSFFSRQLPNRRTLVLLKRNGFVESDGHKCEMYAQTIFNSVKLAASLHLTKLPENPLSFVREETGCFLEEI